MGIGTKISSLSCVLLLFVTAAQGADPGDREQIHAFSESSFITGIGTGKIPEGNYQPLLLILHLGMDAQKYFPTLRKNRGHLSFILEPQVNLVAMPDENYEFGLGMGMQYRYPLTAKLSGYLLGSTGPHYISVITATQANGFIFANTLGGGLYYFLGNDSALNLGYRWRHLSNADLALPNGGINVNFITLGYSFFF